MKKLLLVFFGLATIVAAQPSCTQITDTLYSVGVPNMQTMQGYIDLNLGYAQPNGTFVVTQSLGRLTITNGVLSTCQSGGQYQALYSVQNAGPVASYSKFTQVWTVPMGGGPYTVQDLLGLRAVSLAWASRNVLVYSTTVTNQTIVSVPGAVHKLGANIVVLCDGIAECGQTNVGSDGSVVVSSIVPWSGTVYVLGSPANYSLSFTSALTAAVAWPVVKLAVVYAMACYDASGNQFGSGDLTLTPHPLGISGLSGSANDFGVVLSSAVPVTGRCVFLGE